MAMGGEKIETTMKIATQVAIGRATSHQVNCGDAVVWVFFCSISVI